MLTEGERWVREELERLRFTPAGFGRFLLASWRRSAQIPACASTHRAPASGVGVTARIGLPRALAHAIQRT